MQTTLANIYEQAFECFLTENKLPFLWIDQSKCLAFADGPVKNFDFLIGPDTDSPILVELKGRTFKGSSLAGLKGLDGWVTFADVRSLSRWLGQFQTDTPAARAVFVFAFRFANMDIETDGWPHYDYSGERFLFLAILLQKYAGAMKIRSPKWQTVVINAADFRRHAAKTFKNKSCKGPKGR
ncbi:MAG: hypothetical protein B6I25_07540 [Planctomycetales bacterium 4572_13]|nr:MAG: hypothetical protein B6I25_07540 [Planctomycetales bacterium 4572_13]